jgi:carbonic anhydrase/acetyltransferase-like protein (isoleucine patch superfamily)
MKPLLVTGPDSTLRNVYTLAKQAFPERRVEMLFITSIDYYRFDLSGLQNFEPQIWDVCIAVNEFYINDVRRALHDAVTVLGYQPASVISPRADIDPSAVIGANAVIYGGCVVGANVLIGHHCVLRGNVVLSEDVVLGDYCSLEANVAIREGATVGNFATICANSTVSRMSRVGQHCYLNLQRQYSGIIPDMTSYSQIFQHPIQVFSN